MLVLEDVHKSFGRDQILDSVSLEIDQGELFALLGPSGCGKTTLLRIISGLDTLDRGRVVIDGVDVTACPPWHRPVNMMFQSYALFPHLSVCANIAYGLRRERMPKAEREARVAQMLALTELEAFAQRMPEQLSGGQRQRVALARALAKRPKVLLLDEPLSALDRKLREQTQLELMALQERLGTTFVVVTHDREEAMTLSTRMAVMRAGKFLQIGQPFELYEHPCSQFVAKFLGKVNVFCTQLETYGTQSQPAQLRCLDTGLRFHVTHKRGIHRDTPTTLAMRPEKIQIAAVGAAVGEAGAVPNRCLGTIQGVFYTGVLTSYRVGLDVGGVIDVETSNRIPRSQTDLQSRDRVVVTFDASCWLVLED